MEDEKIEYVTGRDLLEFLQAQKDAGLNLDTKIEVSAFGLGWVTASRVWENGGGLFLALNDMND